MNVNCFVANVLWLKGHSYKCELLHHCYTNSYKCELLHHCYTNSYECELFCSECSLAEGSQL